MPSLPAKLEGLRELAYNLYWSWNSDIQSLFRRLDRDLWEDTKHNPVAMLGRVSQEKLEAASKDDGFLSHFKRCSTNLKNYLSSPTWFSKNYKDLKNFNVVYFSFEYGITECLQTYSGGLGVLAGDHLKSASDLGIPLTAIGVAFKDGYFQQYLNSDGWQQERYEISDFENLPMELVTNNDKSPLVLSVDFPDSKVYFQIWLLLIGRIKLYLLDTNLPENTPENRQITERLYGGNSENRVRQEIILGNGGIKATHALGIKPGVCHMNEGHSAFLSLERIKGLMNEYGLNFYQAREIGVHSNVFTTHTPVPAGIDVFSLELMEKYFGTYYRQELKLTPEEFYKLGALGQTKITNFNMAHLAMNTASNINGVSKLHGDVSRKMWASGFKGIPLNEIPIGHVTNGIHIKSHLAPEMEELLLRYLGESWVEDASNADVWKRIDKIPDEELWRTHERRRERLVAFTRKRLIEQAVARGASSREIESLREVLNPNTLTIGFARRFATYKRANLLFRDIERIQQIIENTNQNVQFIFAGKAHPQDEAGKKFIQEIVQNAKSDNFKKRIAFLENYDMNVARYLVEGCDIWLNNPRRPQEASGTSGMKVIANGGLNFSVLDGWWDEAYSPEVGWKIGNREEYVDLEYQNEVESRELYNILENDILPLFYDRGEDNLPRKWIKMMKNSMMDLTPRFNTARMVKEYVQKYYIPSWEKKMILMANDLQKTKELSAWKKNLTDNWDKIKVISAKSFANGDNVYVNQDYKVIAEISLGKLTPDDVEVQLYYGPSEERANLDNNLVENMKLSGGKSSGGVDYFIYEGSIKCVQSGLFGYTVRILPKNDLMTNSFELKRIFWAGQ